MALRRKGQASAEFMMTYGWVILAVIAVGGAVSYIGYMKPQQQVRESCAVPMAFNCLDASAIGSWSNPEINILLKNEANIDMRDVSISLEGRAAASTATCTTLTGLSFVERQERKLSFSCINTQSGPFRADIIIKYTNVQTGLAHRKIGELILALN